MEKILNSLIKLGFSNQDADVYLSLLKVGESQVGPIISQTGYHREIVYGALKRLEQQGLVQSIVKKRVKQFQACDPSFLLRKMESKAKIAKDVLPSLKSIYKQPEISVKIYEGSEGFEEIEKDWATSLKNNEDFYCIGGAGEAWYEITKDYYKKYHRRLLKRGIHLKTVTYANEATGIANFEDPEFNPIRIIPNKFQVPSSTIIYADKLLIQIFGERPIGIVIKSPAASKAYKKYFDLLWDLAKPI